MVHQNSIDISWILNHLEEFAGSVKFIANFLDSERTRLNVPLETIKSDLDRLRRNIHGDYPNPEITEISLCLAVMGEIAAMAKRIVEESIIVGVPYHQADRDAMAKLHGIEVPPCAPDSIPVKCAGCEMEISLIEGTHKLAEKMKIAKAMCPTCAVAAAKEAGSVRMTRI